MMQAFNSFLTVCLGFVVVVKSHVALLEKEKQGDSFARTSWRCRAVPLSTGKRVDVCGCLCVCVCRLPPSPCLYLVGHDLDMFGSRLHLDL